MENNVKLVSLRTSPEILDMIERIGKKINQREEKELNTSDILRYCIEFTSLNLYKQNLDWEDFMVLMKAYIKTAYFNRFEPTIYQHHFEYNKKNLELLDDLLYAVEQMGEEFEPEEVKEMDLLYSEEEPITLAQLLRFKYRLMPETFLHFMGIEREEYEQLTDDELANFIENKLRDQTFREQAKAMFTVLL